MPKLPHQLPLDLVREDPESLPRLLSTAFDIRLPYARAFAAQGRSEGKFEEEANALLEVLDTREFEVSEEIRQKIMACADIDQLRKWLRQAVNATKIEDVFA